MSPGVVGAKSAQTAETNNNPRTTIMMTVGMLRRRREHPAVSWVNHCRTEELLLGSNHVGVFLHLISLVSRLAGHIFQLEFAQLLDLCDLFRGQLAGEVNRVIPVQEVRSGEASQYREHALFGRQQFSLKTGTSKDTLRRVEARPGPEGIPVGISARRRRADRDQSRISRKGLAKHDIFISERPGQRPAALNDGGQRPK